MKSKFITILLISALLASCAAPYEPQTTQQHTQQTTEPISEQTALPAMASQPLFSQSSPFNTMIDPDYIVDENSDAMIERLLKDMQNGADPILSVHNWSVTAYYADENTQRYDIELKNNWGLEYDYIIDVPIPMGVVPDPKGDGHLAVIDQSTGYVYEFWQFSGEDGDYCASWGNRISLDSTGIYQYGMSSRGSGFSAVLGMIFPEEFASGEINHALVLSIPSTKAGGPVYPATESDGRTKKYGAIPEGARLVLDANINLDDYDLNEYELIICECLQKYGAYVGDTSGSVEFEAVNPLSYDYDPYNDMFNDEWIFLYNIPFEHMQVLELSEQNENPPLYVTDESIYN